MATTTRRRSSSSGSASLPPSRTRFRRPPSGLARAGALALLAAAIGALLYFAVSGPGPAEYHLMFASADELVPGDQVQVGGVPVGSVKSLTLTKRFKASVTISVEPSLLPLHEGTTALIRVPSLSSVANRYIALTPGPNNNPPLRPGSTLPTSKTEGAVNLDQLFNTLNPKTRRGLQELITGFATQYKGAAHDVNVATAFFPPALNATDHFFNELTRDERVFSSFLVEAAKALTVLSAHHSELSGLIGHGATAFEAIGSEASSLESGIRQLPKFLREGNSTFARLPSALAALRKLVNVSKPNTKQLAELFERLRPLLGQATPELRQLSSAISKPGPNNDLTDFALALPGLAKSLKSASPNGVKALNESVPVTSFFGPYAPDLIGLFHDFGQEAGYWDANGHYVRVSPDFADFKLSEDKLVPVNPKEGLEGLITGQLTRCPGSATQPASDGSSPYTDEGKLGCNPAEVP